MSPLRIVFSGLLLTASFAVTASFAGAQPASGEPKVAPATLRDLVQRIQDPERRKQLVAELEALLAVTQKPPSPAPPRSADLLQRVAGALSEMAQRIGNTAAALLEQVRSLPRRVRGFVERLERPRERAVIVRDVLSLAGITILAVILSLLTASALGRPRRFLTDFAAEQPLDTLSRLWRVLLRLGLDLTPAMVAVAATLAGLALAPVTHSTREIALAFALAVAARRVADGVADCLLASGAPHLRLLPVSDDVALALRKSVGRLASIAIYGYFGLQAIEAGGGEPELLAPLQDVYGLVLLVAGIVFVLRYRKPAAVVLQRAEEARPAAPKATPKGRLGELWDSVKHMLLGLWWIVAIAYMVGLYTVWAGGAEDALRIALVASALTALWSAVAAVVITAIHTLTARLQARLRAVLAPLPTLEEQVPRYLGPLRVVLDGATLLAALALVLEAWGVEALALARSPAFTTLVSTALEVLLVVLVAFALSDTTTALTERYLARRKQEGTDTSKVRTLIPLAQKAVRVVVAVLASITVLSQIGVEIGPILAGVGVLGLAIGFGAQTLVKDLITGTFILLEDSVAVGDVVSLDGTGGLVEAIGIRTIRLRDLHGNVHVIPYSSVNKITNMTKGFSRYVVEAGVSYHEDVDEVIAVLKEVGEDLRRDPTYGRDILEPLEILGLDRFEDSAVVVRARLTTKPIRQWAVGREFNKRMKKAFDERGIQIPFPCRTLYMGQEKDGSAAPLHVLQEPPPPASATS